MRKSELWAFISCFLFKHRPAAVKKGVLIHEADPQSRPVVITIFTKSVRPSVPKLQNQATITTGRDCGLAEWIIDESCLVYVVIAYCYPVFPYLISNIMFSLFTDKPRSSTQLNKKEGSEIIEIFFSITQSIIGSQGNSNRISSQL